MDNTLIILNSLILAGMGFFIYLYLTNEKKNKLERDEFSQKVQEALTKYSEDNYQIKQETIRLKEKIEIELQNILKEIKAPLDLE
jgi:hypothetical protein